MLQVTIPKSKAQIEKQIKALKYILKSDIRQKDIEIHSEALRALEAELKAMEG